MIYPYTEALIISHNTSSDTQLLPHFVKLQKRPEKTHFATDFAKWTTAVLLSATGIHFSTPFQIATMEFRAKARGTNMMAWITGRVQEQGGKRAVRRLFSGCSASSSAMYIYKYVCT